MEKDRIKILTKISSFLDCEKSFQNIETLVNDLIKRINTEAESDTNEGEGQTGDTKIIQNANKSFELEIRTKDGWKKATAGGMPVRYGAKIKDEGSKLKKSIAEIETDDTSTGASNAEKTIYDEKEDKFKVSHLTGVPRPDYDSGWVDAQASSSNGATLTHDLGVIPSFAVLHKCRDSAYNSGDPTEVMIEPVLGCMYTTSWAAYYGPMFHFTKTTAVYWIHHNGYIFTNYGSITQADSGTTSENGYFKLLLWK